MNHVLNKILTESVKRNVKIHWGDLEEKVGYPVYLVNNLVKKYKGNLSKGFSLIIKIPIDEKIIKHMSDSLDIGLEIQNIVLGQLINKHDN